MNKEVAMKHPSGFYSGVIVPMITPLTEEGKIDYKSASKLINFLLDNQTIPFILGTTGEAPSIPVTERDTLIQILLENRRPDIPLITGVLGLTMEETINQANKYIEYGIDSVVVTLPYHFELTENQIINYFSILAQNISGNIILYNIPKTVHQSIPISIIDQLSTLQNIIGIKDSECNLKRLEQALSLWNGRNDFFHITGINSLILKGLVLGSKGIVPSTANLVPQLYRKLYSYCLEEKFEKASEVFKKVVELSEIYQKGRTLGESLAALKIIMSEMGLCQPHMMPPLTSVKGKEAEKLLKALRMTINTHIIHSINKL